MKKKCTLIAIANLKGGVGKTTLVVNLAAALGRSGKKILVIDLDFQGNATTGLGLTRGLAKSNVHSVLTNKVQVGEAITSTDIENVDIICSHRDLLDFARSQNSSLGREYLFDEWRNDPSFASYDYVLFDTHPDMDCLTLSALVVSDGYIVPLFAELDPIVGLTDMFQQIETIRKRYNRTLQLYGVLITKFDKFEATHRKLEEKIRRGARKGNYRVFKSVIPASKRLSSSKLMSRPVVSSDTSSVIAGSFMSLAKELLIMQKRIRTNRGAVSFAAVEKQVKREIEEERGEDSDLSAPRDAGDFI